MRRTILSSLFAIALTTVGMASVTANRANAAGKTAVLVLKEHTVGGTSQAQAFVDRLLARLDKVVNLHGAHGTFLNSRSRAVKWIDVQKPSFGIMSLAAYLGLRDKYGLSVIGEANVAQAGGRQYFMVSTSADTLEGCKGATMASDHLDDERFVENIVAAGAFSVGEFQQVPSRRPVQTLKKVLGGEAVCALIDDAQLEYAARLEGGGGLKTVWRSRELPALLVVSFSGVDAKMRARFQKGLSKVCNGAGESVCKEAGISSLSAAKDAGFARLVRAY